MRTRIWLAGGILALGLGVAAVASAQITSPPASVITPPGISVVKPGLTQPPSSVIAPPGVAVVTPGATQPPSSVITPPGMPTVPYSGPPATLTPTFPSTVSTTYPGPTGFYNPAAPPNNQIVPVTPTDTDPTGTLSIGGGLSPNAGSLTPLSLTPLAPGVTTTSPFPGGTTGGLTIPSSP
ncbi:MAG TPA: hypothetical protein VMG58_12190 [Candidatus Sulfotelmatobacter sp.]|nr:hypothetical protein [Candidatus Sulfotelmatobacter sp.]